MFYTLFTLSVFLLLGAPKLVFGFDPIFMAFVIAIIVDLVTNRTVFIRKSA